MRADPAEHLTAAQLKRRNRTLLLALLVGVGLLWTVPLGGALLMVAASFGLVISWETELIGVVVAPARVEPVAPRPVPDDPTAPGSF
jgi:hypothetical protein